MFKQRLRRIEATLKRCHEQALPPRQLQTVQDVIDLLEEQVEAIRAAPWCGTIAKARAIAQLASVARQTMESGVLAARLQALEAVLKHRKAAEKL